MAHPAAYEVERIGEHVVRIPLSLPLADLPLVNTYAILAADGVTLVDPGWLSRPSETEIVAGLAAIGAAPTDVRRILVTHSHWDHYTRALDWQAHYGIEVLLGWGEHATIESFDPDGAVYPKQVDLLRRTGADGLADAVDSLTLEEYEQDMPFDSPDVWLYGGETITCGEHRITAHSTPGHTRGHVVFEDPDAGLLFTGDHLLPRITPSIAFELVPEQQPLTSYIESLRLFADGPDRRMLPAHGPADGSARDRAQELLAHHDARLQAVHDHIATGADTAFEVAKRMRWTRREKTLTQLGTVHAMTAVLEVRAHLEHLVLEGRLGKEDKPVERYAA